MQGSDERVTKHRTGDGMPGLGKSEMPQGDGLHDQAQHHPRRLRSMTLGETSLPPQGKKKRGMEACDILPATTDGDSCASLGCGQLVDAAHMEWV